MKAGRVESGISDDRKTGKIRERVREREGKSEWDIR